MKRLKGDRNPQRQLALDVNIIHTIAELEQGVLNIVHCHYDYELLTITPMHKLRSGEIRHVFET